MTQTERYRHLEALFHAWVDLDQATRFARLQQLAQDEPELHRELSAMFQHSSVIVASEKALDALAQSAGEFSGSAIPNQIGPYTVLRQIGQGGMGQVFEGEQSDPVRRRVAIKLARAGLADERAIARFQAERQTLTVLEHPNIARILDAGTHSDGRPWFAMELVEGVSIAHWVETHNLGFRERIELLLPVCEAVQHAHLKGVIHRDLKPANVLVSLQDGVATPRIIDFGIAKVMHGNIAFDSKLTTQSGEIIGTPEYMSPEQASMGALDIDTRTDVYALGLLLFELLVGELPISLNQLRSFAFDEMCKRIREDEARPPSQILQSRTSAAKSSLPSAEWARRLRGDLDAVVLKALAKDREQRYISVSDFAADLRRYLSDQPVHATPPKWRYRLRKWAKRNRALAAAAVIASIALGLGTSLGISGYRQAQRAAIAANASQAEAESVAEFTLGLFKAADPRREPGKSPSARDLLASGVVQLKENPGSKLAPNVRMRMQEELAASAIALGDYPMASELLEQALKSREQEQPSQPKRIAFIFDRLSFIAIQQGNWKQAIDHARAALDQLQQVGHHSLARYSSDAALRSLNNLAFALRKNEQLVEAEQTLQVLFRLSVERGPTPNPYSAGAKLDQAYVFLDQERFDEAIAAQQQALLMFRQLHPENHPTFGAIYNNQSFVQRKAGNLSVALSLARQAKVIQDINVPASHPGRAEVLFNEAAAMIRLGQLEYADQLLKQALLLLDTAFGADSAKRWMYVDAGADIAIRRKQFSAATRDLQLLLAGIGEDASTLPQRFSSFYKLALAQRGQGNFSDASKSAEQARALVESATQPRDQAVSELLLALLALDRNQREAADAHYARALALDPRCDTQPCALDQAHLHITRAHYLARVGQSREALNILRIALEHRDWSADLLDHDDLKSLHQEPEWKLLQHDLARRIAIGKLDA